MNPFLRGRWAARSAVLDACGGDLPVTLPPLEPPFAVVVAEGVTGAEVGPFCEGWRASVLQARASLLTGEERGRGRCPHDQ